MRVLEGFEGSEVLRKWVSGIAHGGEFRELVFEFWKQEFGERIGDGEQGMMLYADLLDIVRSSGKDEAVEEFQKVFVPLQDQELLQRKLLGALEEGLENKSRSIDKALGAGGDDALSMFFRAVVNAYKADREVPYRVVEYWEKLPRKERELVLISGITAMVEIDLGKYKAAESEPPHGRLWHMGKKLFK